MRLTFIGKDPESNPTGSSTVYRTDRAPGSCKAGSSTTRTHSLR